jgi:uncharacterized membrane protein
MSRRLLRKIPLRADPLTPWLPRFQFGFLVLFAICSVVVLLRLLFQESVLPTAHWPEGVLLVVATAAVLASVTRHLPGQNVILASAIVALLGTGVQITGTIADVPFGPFVYGEEFGPELFHPLPWAVPVLFLFMVFSSREVGRLILRPWRKSRTYGFRLIGLTIALVIFFDLGFQPFATRVHHYWFWQASRAVVFWYGTPWVNFFGRAATTIVILAFATPSLINKRQMKQPPDYSPLIIWLVVQGLFSAGVAREQLWLAVALIAVGSGVVCVLAVKGARW